MEEKVTRRSRVGMRGIMAIILGSLCIGLLITPDLKIPPPSGRVYFTEGVSSAHAASSNPQGLPNFIDLAKELRPAVVNISTSQVGGGGQQSSPSPFGEEDPFSEFWRRFFGDPLPRGPFRRQKSLGSGFVLDREGYILTNNHVVESGDKIIVRLSDEKEFEAKLVGRDAKTD
ncbi:MAG: trypsin-like peptidase domain-containing protein, partial [Nitrospirales bacterium]